jgi:hypothetical protein
MSQKSDDDSTGRKKKKKLNTSKDVVDAIESGEYDAIVPKINRDLLVSFSLSLSISFFISCICCSSFWPSRMYYAKISSLFYKNWVSSTRQQLKISNKNSNVMLLLRPRPRTRTRDQQVKTSHRKRKRPNQKYQHHHKP